jgi:hypothetical protein
LSKPKLIKSCRVEEEEEEYYAVLHKVVRNLDRDLAELLLSGTTGRG